MECGAREMRKSTRPAGGTSKPYSHIPDTSGGCNSSNGNLLPGTISGGKNNHTDNDPRWEPDGGARPQCASL